jgi:hypothetical protein
MLNLASHRGNERKSIAAMAIIVAVYVAIGNDKGPICRGVLCSPKQSTQRKSPGGFGLGSAGAVNLQSNKPWVIGR